MGELLGLPLVRSWGEPKVEGLMYGAGTSLIEIFPNAEEDLPQGAIRHFALATDDVDSIVETVRKAGYAVTMEPGDIEIMSKPSLPARIAFIIGPVGEEIELFCEKTIECTLCEHSIVPNAKVLPSAIRQVSKTPRAAQNSPSPRAGIRSCFQIFINIFFVIAGHTVDNDQRFRTFHRKMFPGCPAR